MLTKKEKIFSTKEGFSLTEVVIGVALMGLVIIVICGVFVQGLNAIKKGKYRAMALHIANQKYSELTNVDWSHPYGIVEDDLCSPPTGYIEGSSYSSSGGYIDWTGGSCIVEGSQTMDNIDYDYRIIFEPYGTAMKNLKKVSVIVRWKEINGEQKVRLCTLISRKN